MNCLDNSARVYKVIFTGLLLFRMTISGWGQEVIPDQPVPPRLVNDFASFLSVEEVNTLEKKLVEFNNSTSTQIVIVTLNDLGGYEIADFAVRLGEKWGVGQEGFDNGIVILVKPGVQGNKGEVSITTGYGLEGAVPDAVANRIIDIEILPSFREGKYSAGLIDAVNVLIELTKGEYSADEYLDRSGRSGKAIGIFILFAFIFFISFISRIRRGRQYSPGHHIPLWTALFLAGSSSRSFGGGFSNFSSGGGSFGGFGGGSFGGGGASGSW